MPDDDEISKLQQLEAQARAAQRTAEDAAARSRSPARRLAEESRAALGQAETDLARARDQQARARVPGVPPLEAADLLREGKGLEAAARKRAVQARAKLEFALDRLDAAERAELAAQGAPGGVPSEEEPEPDPGHNQP